MSPDGKERRCGTGRRGDDFCADHKWLVSSVSSLSEIVHTHTGKLEKFFGRINTILVTFCIGLLAIILDIILRWHKLGG